MYKIASELAQRRSRQLWLDDLQTDGFQQLTLEEQRETLQHRWKSVNAQIILLDKKDPKRVELGKICQEIQEKIRAIRPKIKAKAGQDIPSRFIEVARERMTKAMFRIWWEEATRRAGCPVKLPSPTPDNPK